MTADIRTAAQAEAERLTAEHPESPSQDLEDAAFVAGAVWGAAYVTPTREQIAKTLMEASNDPYFQDLGFSEIFPKEAKRFYEVADAVLDLLNRKE